MARLFGQEYQDRRTDIPAGSPPASASASSSVSAPPSGPMASARPVVLVMVAEAAVATPRATGAFALAPWCTLVHS